MTCYYVPNVICEDFDINKVVNEFISKIPDDAAEKVLHLHALFQIESIDYAGSGFFNAGGYFVTQDSVIERGFPIRLHSLFKYKITYYSETGDKRYYLFNN